ncbi:MAG TPA: TonB-dependent receptor [Chitinophagaceae bacterium]|nr:TonB-dependent receptor [Chitinophagaceae bacterium]
MKRSFIYLFILMLLGSASTALAQGEIYGEVRDESGAPFPGVVVKVFDGGILKSGNVSEDDGTFSVKPLLPGTYDVEFSSSSYATKRYSGVVVTSGGSTRQNVKMEQSKSAELNTVIITAEPPIVKKETTMGGKELDQMGMRPIQDAVSLGKNVQQERSGGAIRIGGARLDGTVYMIDGQMIAGTSNVTPAQGTVGQLQVFTSGIPANLGDATGGVVSITTRGVSNKLRTTIQGQHSFEGYNQNLVNATVTGPIVSKMKDGVKQTVFGFLAGFDYQYNQDDNPTFVKNPVLKGDVLKKLQDNPLTLLNGANGNQLAPSSNFVTKDDFVMQKRSINNTTQVGRFNGKLDYAVNQNINITAGGNFNINSSDNYSRAASYFAPESIATNEGFTARGYLRFRQSFNNPTKSASDSGKSPVITNAYYTVQLDYEYSSSQTQNSKFKRNLFDYGYVGKFNQSRVPIYTFGEDSLTKRRAVVLQTLDAVNGITFQASDKNPILANYTKNVYDNRDVIGVGGVFSDLTAIQRNGGMMNGDFPRYALDIQNVRQIPNVGAGFTGYGYGVFSQVGLHADASFDFKPAKTTHAIQFGLYYEQRSSSNYSANVNTQATGNNSIWNLMNSLTNSHILAFDYANPIFIHNGQRYTKQQVDDGAFFGPTDTIIYNRRDNGAQSTFDANLRSKLGAGQFDYIDVHSIDPSKLSLDMFSADELLGQSPNASFVSYNGYDYTGKKLSGRVNFNDFFKDPSRPIGAFTPNYIAGYVMDQFRFQKMKFNIGVRIERYDNNTKVLKDPYSLYELSYKSDVDGSRNLENGGRHPGNIGDNYAVYVNNNNSLSPTVIGYRNGDKWYNATGVEIPDPTVLKTKNGGVDPQPYLTTAGKTKITDANFDPNNSFTDYKPKVTASPRFQFDFPINDDKALFYAHYDILVQRPKSGNFATPLDYYFLEQQGSNIIGNPNLQPEKTFDYELGYQQEITRNSGIGISAFYRERKDMIQVRPYLYAFPITYYTYGNRDFSTTKGFTFTYDYRKPKASDIPVSMTLAYTLQFADGTGSSATSGNGGSGSQFNSSGLTANFISAGLPNLRYVSPLTYDSRHNINLNLFYTYDEGEGPTVNNKHILQNFVGNLILRARSGEPYTTVQNVVGNAIQGGLNGTRKPWHFGIDLRVEKRFLINGDKKAAPAADGSSAVAVTPKKRYYLSAFVLCQNIFNIKDVLNMYSYTSRPDDDGYVASPNGEQFFNTSNSPQTLRDLYSLYVNNPNNYNLPRRIYAGFSFSF